MANFLAGVGDKIEKTLGLNPQTKDILINSQIPLFRGYGREGNIEIGNNRNLELEDPSYIIFDINIDQGSPLLNDVDFFLNYYGVFDKEIKDAKYLYSEFIDTLKLIFPMFSDNAGKYENKSGRKRHYINSISGLDNLNKPIINYPEDKITFKLSEDITMLVQYLSELYSNLTYSFATNRQLIPSNLLYFDMYVILSDVRDMKKGLKKVGKNYADEISEDKSKFIYVLHDCEFNFFTSKLHGDEVTVGGYSTGPTTTPSTVNINLNFKSYSRILSSSLINGAYLLDYRLKKDGFDEEGRLKKLTGKKNTILGNKVVNTTNINNYEPFYNKFNNDYKTQDEFEENNTKRYNVNGVDPTDPVTSEKGYFNKLTDKAKNTVKGIGSSMINKLHNEVDTLKSTAQKGISSALGINLTLTKINVYFETPEEKLDRLSLLTSNIADNIGRNINKTTENLFNGLGDAIKGKDYNRINNINLGSMGKDIGKDALDGLVGALSGKKLDGEMNESNIYKRDIDSDYMRSGKDITTEIVDNNDKNPEGDLNIDGQYNQKFPEGDLHEKSTYNQKFPTGDLHKKPTYNEKYPTGDLHKKPTYNEKYPKGDLNVDGQYNIKFPDGDRHIDGQYNIKFPEGDRHNDGKYNEKYPKGDLNIDSVYNEKYPIGDLNPDGQYNIKFPDGDLNPDGQYNIKFPENNVYKNK